MTCTKITALFRESRNIKLHEIVDSFDFSETTPEMKAFFEGKEGGRRHMGPMRAAPGL